jgi:uncharacterized protein YjiS (DUF1127 family)
MATVVHSHNRTVGRFLADAVRSLSFRVQVSIAQARDRRRIAHELSTYSDDELAELGFSRLDIQAVAAGTYRR